MNSRNAKLILRAASDADADACRELARRAMASWGLDEAQIAQHEAHWAQARARANIVLAEYGGKLAAWVATTAPRKARSELYGLFVDPAYLRRGVGSALMLAARRAALTAGAEMIVGRVNRKAAGFFLAQGGQLAGGGKPDKTKPEPAVQIEFPLTLEIRAAEREDADEISELIAGLSDAFLLEPDSADDAPILRSFTSEAIARYVESERYIYFIGEMGGTLIGVAALRDDSHLFHLFVAAPWQGLGFSAQLWEAVRDDAIDEGQAGEHEFFSVNSTLRAVPVYERFGFRAVGPRVEKNGIAFVPMQLAVASAR